MKRYSILPALTICVGLASQAAYAVTCLPNLLPSNPDTAYFLPAIDNHTVTHLSTGLTWKRCSEGQTWLGGSCDGTPGSYTWSQALTIASAATTAGYTDWRVPNVKELRSLVEECRSAPAINNTIFPNTASQVYWSSTPYTDFSGVYTWAVEFSGGLDVTWARGNAFPVRLVRGGDYFDSMAAAGSPAEKTALLSVSAVGSGTITTNPSGISCAANASILSGTCQAAFDRGTSVTLTASPAGGKPFIGWNGVCSGTATTCTLNMRAAESAVALFAAVNTQTQTIGAITFLPTTLAVGGTTTASATASSGLAVSFSSTTLSICTVSGNIVSGVAAGTCTIAANQAGNGSYAAAAQVTQTIAVKASQTIGAISFTPTTLAVGGTTTAGAVGGASGNPVIFSSLSSGTCTVSGSIVTGVAAGTCTIAANQAGGLAGGIDYAAATQVTQTIAVAKGSQTISVISFLPTSLAAGGTTTVSATATSGLAVGFTSSTLSKCTVSGSTVTGVAGGTCTITASQSGNANYLAATPVTQSIQVKASQTIGPISFSPTTLAAGGTTTASATGGLSGNPVTFSSTSLASICTVTPGGLVTGFGVGNCVVVANQLGNTNYADATPVTQSITVSQGSQTIGPISFLPTTLTVGGTSTASATASSGLQVSFTSANPTICTVNGSTVTGVAVPVPLGPTCIIAATQAGNANYSAAPAVVAIIPFSQSQTISAISFSPTSLTVGGTTTASATATSGLPVVFSGGPTSICTVSGSTITGVAAGTCIIKADQAGDATHLTAPQVTQNINVKKGQTINPIGFSPTNLAVGGMTAATAAASSGLAVSFSSTTPTICDVTSDGTVTGKTVGTCTIAANQAGDTTWAPATQVTGPIAVAQGSQSIGAITLSAVLRAGGTSIAQATASSLLQVSFSTSSSSSICTVSGSTVTGVGAGTCTILANQTGNANYLAVTPTVSQGFAVLNSQTIGAISFSPNNLLVAGATTATATASSGLAVSFNSASPGICTVSGSTVTGVAAGTCTITASQAGDGVTWAAAVVPAVRNITVDLASQTISLSTFTFTPATLNVGATTQASAAATSGLPVSFSSSTPSICTVSGTNGNIVAGDNPGTCTITASQDGFQGGIQNYNAVSVQKDIAVTPTTVSFSPDALTFDPQYVGTTSAPKIVTLTNTGGGRLNITSILPTLNVFAVSGNTCGNRVNAGASCTISVTFSPAATGTRVGSIRVISNSANGTDSFTVSGQGVASGAPICTLTAAPARIQPGRSSTLTANCSPVPTSYSWTGGTCASTGAATCTATPALTTTYGVTGTNSFGSFTASATVTVKPVDLTPILMLLLD